MATPNWLDALLYGIRYVYDSAGVLLSERPSIQFTGSADVADDPVNKRTVVTIRGTTPDGLGGYVVGAAAGGWVSIKSDGFGFRVYNDDESDWIFRVDNNVGLVTVNASQQLKGELLVADSSAAGAPSSGIVIQSVSGAFRVKQHATPSVSGSRADTEQALKNLLAALATTGLITDSTTT